MSATRTPDTRPDHWFTSHAGRAHHVKAAEGDWAVCSKAIRPRIAPHDETGEWGTWYQTDEYLGQWEHVKRCPKCQGDA